MEAQISFETVILHPLYKDPDVALQGHMVVLFFIIWGTSILISRVAAPVLWLDEFYCPSLNSLILSSASSRLLWKLLYWIFHYSDYIFTSVNSVWNFLIFVIALLKFSKPGKHLNGHFKTPSDKERTSISLRCISGVLSNCFVWNTFLHFFLFLNLFCRFSHLR